MERRKRKLTAIKEKVDRPGIKGCFPTAKDTTENTAKLGACNSPASFLAAFKEIGNLNACIVATSDSVAKNILNCFMPTKSEKTSHKRLACILLILAMEDGWIPGMDMEAINEMVVNGRHNYSLNEQDLISDQFSLHAHNHGNFDFEKKTIYTDPNIQVETVNETVSDTKTKSRRVNVEINRRVRSINPVVKPTVVTPALDDFDFDETFSVDTPVVKRSWLVWNNLLYCRIDSASLDDKPLQCCQPDGTMTYSTLFGPDYTYVADKKCMASFSPFFLNMKISKPYFAIKLVLKFFFIDAD
jgi:hypothetical protein